METIDMITALTVSGILAILLIYVVIVYKKGWLRGNSKGSKTFYLCPSTKCRRVFKEPIWLTDLSKTPPESFQSCPHCGTSLQTPPSFSPRAGTEIKATFRSQASQSGDHSSQAIQYPQRESNVERTNLLKETPKQIAPKASLHDQLPQSTESRPTVKKPQSTQVLLPREIHMPPAAKPVPTSQRPDDKKPSSGLKACQHYLGYVRTLPKSTPIPDECMWCSLIVKCLTGAEKIEA